MAGENIIEVTDQNFEEVVANSDKLVLLDFWAAWCGPCMALGPTMDSLADEYAGRLVIGKVNIQDAMNTAQKCHISAIPTIVFFKDGQVVESVVGAKKRGAYVEIIEKHL